MTAVLAALLAGLALVDGTLAGFRASVGRSGLVRHRAEDLQGARRGLLTSSASLAPAVALCIALAVARGTADLDSAARAMLWVYLPFGVVILLALLAYLVLGWQQRYLASAVILGPLTLARPWVVVAGGGLGIVVAADVLTAVAVALAVVGVLAVEPLCNVRYRSALVDGEPVAERQRSSPI